MALQALLMTSPSPIGPSRQPQYRRSTRETPNIGWKKIPQTLQNLSLENQHVAFFHVFQQSYITQLLRSAPVVIVPAWNTPGPSALRYLYSLNQQQVAVTAQECSLSSKGTDAAAWAKSADVLDILRETRSASAFVKIRTSDAISCQIKGHILMREHLGGFSPQINK